ncbi:MAG TPA: hemolysin III family protein [Vicinamibacteria bacterium]|nr:hemolysin III family protein [Vicinamibacteria bacterium]
MSEGEATAGQPRRGEGIANSVSHGVGAVLGLAGLVVLARSASGHGARTVVGCVVFGVALVLLYSASTLYHSVGPGHPRAKAVLRVLDHSAIFLLVAGTYTPFTLVSLRGPWGWSLFGVVWGLALAGITLRLVLPRRPTTLFVALYLAMGWCVVVAAKPLLAAVAPGGIALLAAGGVAYTVGVAFYAWRSLPYGHAIWHGFVLAGSAFHFAAVLLYVARA